MEDNHSHHNKEAEEKIIQDVKDYGYHMALLEDDGYLPGFVFSIGFYQSYQHPEIIIFGLKQELMKNLLHHVAEELKKGMTFKPNIDYEDFLSNYPIRFIEVDKEHYADYLGYCGWFYDGTFDFPAYQLVWTDKGGKYPWEENFNQDWKFKQAILDRNTDFKFYEERALGVYTTQKTLDGAPVLWVYHNRDGDWQFHSEEDPEIENARIVCLEDLIKDDPSLNELHHLNYGQSAVRSNLDDKWEIYNSEEEE